MKHLKPYNESFKGEVTADKISELIQLYQDCFADIIDAGAYLTIEVVRESHNQVGLFDTIYSMTAINTPDSLSKLIYKYGLKNLHIKIRDMYQDPDNELEDPYEKVNPDKSQQRLSELYDEIVKNLQGSEKIFNGLSDMKLSNISTRIEIITKEEYTEDDSDRKRMNSLMKGPHTTSVSSTGTPLGHARLKGYTLGIRQSRGIIKKIKDYMNGGSKYEFPKLEEGDRIRSIDIIHNINIYN